MQLNTLNYASNLSCVSVGQRLSGSWSPGGRYVGNYVIFRCVWILTLSQGSWCAFTKALLHTEYVYLSIPFHAT